MSDNHRYMYRVNMVDFCTMYPHMEELINSVRFDRSEFNICWPSDDEVLVEFEGIEVYVSNITNDDLAEKIAVEIIRDEMKKRKPRPLSISDFASFELTNASNFPERKTNNDAKEEKAMSDNCCYIHRNDKHIYKVNMKDFADNFPSLLRRIKNREIDTGKYFSCIEPDDGIKVFSGGNIVVYVRNVFDEELAKKLATEIIDEKLSMDYKTKQEIISSHLERTGVKEGKMNKDHPQPSPQPNNSKPIWDMVIADMKARNQIGTERYGTPLQVNNGRDFLRDQYEELLDAVAYTKGALIERDQKPPESIEFNYDFNQIVDITTWDIQKLIFENVDCDTATKAKSLTRIRNQLWSIIAREYYLAHPDQHPSN